jgi:hypothetical protein
MKASWTANGRLTVRRHDPLMSEATRPQLDVVRVLLLLQGAVLLATALEALLFGIAFMGAPGLPFLLSGGAAAAVLLGRARLGPDRDARLLLAVEGLILVTFGIDTALAFFITHGAPPAVAILTRFALPIAVLALLRRSTTAPSTIRALEGGA